VRRATVAVPLGVAGGLFFWFLTRQQHDASLLADLISGFSLGLGLAAAKLVATYRSLYKTRVLPQLAARFGKLFYRPARKVGFENLSRYSIFGDLGSIDAEDEIAGAYRNLEVCITELSLKAKQGSQDESVFDGPLTEIVLPRHLMGTTVVVAEKPLRYSRRRSSQWDGLERVRLENPTFERHYVVYASDQIQARALLTPAFMERLLALATASSSQFPGVLAEGNRLRVALPRRFNRKLFEPPNFLEYAGGTALAALAQEIEAVLSICDSIIALDFFAQSSASGALPATANRAKPGGVWNGGHAVSVGATP
jgi:hypothetical protein